MPIDQALGDRGKEKLSLTGKNLLQNQAQGGAAICHVTTLAVIFSN